MENKVEVTYINLFSVLLGISGALQHDSVVQSGSQGGNLRIHTEAKMRAEKSLEALRKSRLDNWRW